MCIPFTNIFQNSDFITHFENNNHLLSFASAREIKRSVWLLPIIQDIDHRGPRCKCALEQTVLPLNEMNITIGSPHFKKRTASNYTFTPVSLDASYRE